MSNISSIATVPIAAAVPIATPAQISNLMKIVLGTLCAKKEENLEVLRETNNEPMPSIESWEKGDVIQEVKTQINGKMISASTLIQKIQPAINSLKRVTEEGGYLNVCDHFCGKLFCPPRVMKYREEQSPDLDIPCLFCWKTKECLNP